MTLTLTARRFAGGAVLAAAVIAATMIAFVTFSGASASPEPYPSFDMVFRQVDDNGQESVVRLLWRDRLAWSTEILEHSDADQVGLRTSYGDGIVTYEVRGGENDSIRGSDDGTVIPAPWLIPRDFDTDWVEIGSSSDERSLETRYELGGGSVGDETLVIQRDTRIPLNLVERVDGQIVLTIDVDSLVVGDVTPVQLPPGDVLVPDDLPVQPVATAEAPVS